jgi:hypothetical protein
MAGKLGGLNRLQVEFRIVGITPKPINCISIPFRIDGVGEKVRHTHMIEGEETLFFVVVSRVNRRKF